MRVCVVGVCMQCVCVPWSKGRERPGICRCFYGSAGSLLAPPRHLFSWDLFLVCVCVCVCLEGGRGASPQPLACFFFVSPFQFKGVVSVETDLNFKPIHKQKEGGDRVHEPEGRFQE